VFGNLLGNVVYSGDALWPWQLFYSGRQIVMCL